jgi:hypothetical protein
MKKHIINTITNAIDNGHVTSDEVLTSCLHKMTEKQVLDMSRTMMYFVEDEQDEQLLDEY